METQQNVQSKLKMSLSFLFLSLGVLVTLVTSVVSLLNLIFSALDKKFPDVLNASYEYGYSSYDYESMRMSLATLVIFFPIFLTVSYFWKKAYRKGVERIDEVVRKCLIYIIVFVSSLVVAIDLVVLVKYFVSGEITSRFIIKVVAVLIVAMLVGVYYFFELKNRKKFWGVPVGPATAIKASVLVILVIWFSFTVMGSPMEQRSLRLDAKRVGDLQNIQWQVISYWQQKEALPETLEDISNPLSGSYIPVDPEFEKGKSYEYIKKGELVFDLCATFALPMEKGWREYGGGGGVFPMMERGVSTDMAYPYYGGGNESWDHEEAGRVCFERTIDKDLYPPYPKPL